MKDGSHIHSRQDILKKNKNVIISLLIKRYSTILSGSWMSVPNLMATHLTVVEIFLKQILFINKLPSLICYVMWEILIFFIFYNQHRKGLKRHSRNSNKKNELNSLYPSMVKLMPVSECRWGSVNLGVKAHFGCSLASRPSGNNGFALYSVTRLFVHHTGHQSSRGWQR